jgi:hypothetical protein
MSQAVTKIAVGALSVGFLLFLGSQGAARDEMMLRIFVAALVVFAFPIVYGYYFLRAAGQIADEKDNSIALLETRVASEAKTDELQSHQIEATKQQLAFFRSVLGPKDDRLFDFKIEQESVAITFGVEPGESEFEILMQDICCTEETEICLVLSTDSDEGLGNYHRGTGDYAFKSNSPRSHMDTRSVIITPKLASKAPHGANIHITLSSLSGERGNASVKFEATGFRGTARGPDFFTETGSGTLLATRQQVRWVCVLPVSRASFVGGNILAGPKLR